MSRGILTAAVIVWAAIPGFGQGPQAPAETDNFTLLSEYVQVLRLAAVRRELDLTDAQKQQLSNIVPQQAVLGPAPTPEKIQQDDAKIREILTPQQRERLVQLSLQWEGEKALLRPGIADRLGLSPEQRAKLVAVDRTAPEPPNSGASTEERSQWQTAYREWLIRADDERLAVLNDQQRTKWNELNGPDPQPAAPAVPREFRTIRTPPSGYFSLVSKPEICEELALTKEQLGRVAAMTREYDKLTMASLFRPRNQTRRPPIASTMDEMMDRMLELHVRLDERVPQFLEPQQMARLQELIWQQQGALALLDQSVAEKLQLAVEQRAELRNVVGAFEDSYRRLQNDGTVAMTARMSSIREAQQKRDDGLNAVLTNRQQEKWRELKGREFVFAPTRGSLPPRTVADSEAPDPVESVKMVSRATLARHLRSPFYWRDLDLTPEQMRQLENIVPPRGAPEAGTRNVNSPEVDQKIRAVFTDKQVERAVQILLQSDGEKALVRPAVADRLELTPDQREKIAKVAEARPQPKAPAQDAPAEQLRAWYEQQRAWEQQLNADRLAILTDEQRAKWKELKGPESQSTRARFPFTAEPEGPVDPNDNTRLVSSISIGLRLSSIRRELQVSADQAQQLDEAFPRAAFAVGRAAEREEAEKARKILTPPQLDRLVQLLLQQDAESALSRPAVADRLGLTAEQRNQISKIMGRERPRPPAAGAAREELSAWSEERQRVQQQINADALAELTDEQRVKWSELKGPQSQRAFRPTFRPPSNPTEDRAKQATPDAAPPK